MRSIIIVDKSFFSQQKIQCYLCVMLSVRQPNEAEDLSGTPDLSCNGVEYGIGL
jgi:hypothetical protein